MKLFNKINIWRECFIGRSCKIEVFRPLRTLADLYTYGREQYIELKII